MPTALITGANRGIGLEFARQYAGDGWEVHACCRSPGSASELSALTGSVVIHQADVTDTARLFALAGEIDAPIDALIANAGVGGRTAGEFGGLDYEAWRGVLDVNLYGAVATCEAFAPLVRRAKGKIAIITSKMGSIADASGGAMAYRTSKTAVNMASKVIAAALAADGVGVGLFHPGWVETDMGGPNALIDAATSVAGLRRLIEATPASETPRYLDYAGKEIPW